MLLSYFSWDPTPGGMEPRVLGSIRPWSLLELALENVRSCFGRGFLRRRSTLNRAKLLHLCELLWFQAGRRKLWLFWDWKIPHFINAWSNLFWRLKTSHSASPPYCCSNESTKFVRVLAGLGLFASSSSCMRKARKERASLKPAGLSGNEVLHTRCPWNHYAHFYVLFLRLPKRKWHFKQANSYLVLHVQHEAPSWGQGQKAQWGKRSLEVREF